MQITASLVNELRQKTGVGMMQCKKALTETDGDMDKAVELLRKQGAAVAAKRADKAAKEGRVYLVVQQRRLRGSRGHGREGCGNSGYLLCG